MRGIVSGIVVALCASSSVVLAACSGPDDQGEPPPASPPATTPGQSDPTRTEGAEVTLRGTVSRGVEPNCLVLTSGGREYLLLEGGPEVRPGAEVVVHGTLRPGMATTCMQGTPLVVDDADLVEGGST
ncbi:hypothetical protein SAXI111661_07745 [Saccharomonospora xinjiangensis]|uniref:hypothetical protein n=1 Tax=Saccharomonospora xinjiangensis TaxID=75294 RepID=UPI00106F6515|nr:hypothetical protein [Saccharomonospora xinjiangensis]QBQ59273.1 hypothetical protein EYD13_04500 [Saccharomonospora xinjiangensis]